VTLLRFSAMMHCMPDEDPPIDVTSASGPVWRVGRVVPGPATVTWDHVIGDADNVEGGFDDYP
jgi:hypothetical protein